MLDPELLAYLVCPATHQDVREADLEEVGLLNRAIAQGRVRTVEGKPVSEAIDGALIRADGLVAYAVRDEIPVMLVGEALHLQGLQWQVETRANG